MEENNVPTSPHPISPAGALPFTTETDPMQHATPPLPFRPHFSRQNTMMTEGGRSSRGVETCRICRSEGTLAEPLFHPCKCSGSIKHVHQECLMEWLSHSHKKHCELCKTPFRFTKLYDADMPEILPWGVFLKQAAKHFWWGLVRWMRGILVASVWLGVLPWLVRRTWRVMFWFTDAGWARDEFMRIIKRGLADGNGESTHANADMIGMLLDFTPFIQVQDLSSRNGNASWVNSTQSWAATFGLDWPSNVSSPSSANTTWLDLPRVDTSILSSYSWAVDLTPSRRLNKILLDIFEGQVITATVIIGFILVFLIREWVVQQQPLVNLDNAQEQLRDVNDRLQEEHERIRRQQELLDQARQRLNELQQEIASNSDAPGAITFADLGAQWEGWAALDDTIDHATEHLRRSSEADHRIFEHNAQKVAKQMIAARIAGRKSEEVAEKVTAKLNGFSDGERRQWRAALLSAIDETFFLRVREEQHGQAESAIDVDADANSDSVSSESSSVTGELTNAELHPPQRPPLDRDAPSRSNQIQRSLEELAGSSSGRERTSSPPVTGFAPQLPQSHGLFHEDARASSSSSDSWQHVTPPTIEEGHSEDRKPKENGLDPSLDDLPIPVTNAGPDARLKIKRASNAKGKRIILQPPRDEPRLQTDVEMKRRLDQVKPLAQDVGGLSNDRDDGHTETEEQRLRFEDQESLTDYATANLRDEDSISHRITSAFREEFGIDEAEELEHLRVANVGQNGNVNARATSNAEDADGQEDLEKGPLDRLFDWFWGDLEVTASAEAPVPMNDDLANALHAPDLPLLPAVNNALEVLPEEAVEFGADDIAQDNVPERDPEVIAAAQQAGLDADAIDDAEDLEGLFELIGMQGPIIGLFQTATFCTVLVVATIVGAVCLPYVWGKLVLSFTRSPMSFLVKAPLKVASFVTDLIVDTTLLSGSWLVVTSAMAVNACFVALQPMYPSFSESKTLRAVMDGAFRSAQASGTRLQNMFLTTGGSNATRWYWSFLSGSCHSHQALKDLEGEVRAVLTFFRQVFEGILEYLLYNSAAAVNGQSSVASDGFSAYPTKLGTALQALLSYVQTSTTAATTLGNKTAKFLIGMKSNGLTLTLTSSDRSFDPALIHWSPSDRWLTIAAGYISLAAVAALYVAADRPITTSESGKKTEKFIRDTLRQAGGVLKVIVIISIEMLLFPFYCGILLDLAFLPLFEGATVPSRAAFAATSPATFCFVHWITGTAYMFHFALFVGMCRKVLRKGVLWFIRDPDDPTFHPVRDVLERSVVTQLRKIAFSAMVYGALVILCVGGVVWTIGEAFEDVFPLHWVSTEPILEFPLDLLLYNFVTPLVLRMIKPSDAVQGAYSWWLKKCARQLRLSHFLFDTRQEDEEVDVDTQAIDKSSVARSKDVKPAESTHASQDIHRYGGFRLTPCNDQYRPPKRGEAYLHVTDTEVFIGDENGKKNDQFTVVYVPPRFRLRLFAFVICLWLLTAFTAISSTLVPLTFGRMVLRRFLADGASNDIYAYTVGAYILGALLTLSFESKPLIRYWSNMMPSLSLRTFLARVKTVGLRTCKCLYVYGFLGIVLPMAFSLLLHFYFILPLHTYAAFMKLRFMSDHTSRSVTIVRGAEDAFASMSPARNFTAAKQTHGTTEVVEHSIHILQNYALGLLYIRIFSRMIMAAPASRLAEAFRRITEPGYLNPNVRLATRFLILPVTLATVAFIFTPLGVAKVAMITAARGFELTLTDTLRVKLYRYAYPMAGSWLLAAMGTLEAGRATGRWRARIRDEVYLVGEKLHNFGESKPPEGSKSILRRDR